MNRFLQKLRTVLSVDPRWAFRHLKNPSVRSFYWARLTRRTYYDADIESFPMRFAFFSHVQHKIARELSNRNLWEPSLLTLWKEKAKSASVIYDVGGFNGLFGMVAARATPRAWVVIFEPDPFNVRHVRENLKINNIQNCSVEEIALTDHSGTVFFSAKGKLGSHISRHNNGVQVRAKTLDSFPPADLIKIDVEGVEAKVIAGGKHSLEKKPVIFLEVHDQLTESEREEMWGTLKGNGYAWRQIGGSEEGNPHFILEQEGAKL